MRVTTTQESCGSPVLSAHLQVETACDCHGSPEILQGGFPAQRFAIEHPTLQVDHRDDPATMACPTVTEQTPHGVDDWSVTTAAEAHAASRPVHAGELTFSTGDNRPPDGR